MFFSWLVCCGRKKMSLILVTNRMFCLLRCSRSKKWKTHFLSSSNYLCFIDVPVNIDMPWLVDFTWHSVDWNNELPFAKASFWVNALLFLAPRLGNPEFLAVHSFLVYIFVQVYHWCLWCEVVPGVFPCSISCRNITAYNYHTSLTLMKDTQTL